MADIQTSNCKICGKKEYCTCKEEAVIRSMANSDLHQYWVDEESPYIHEDKVEQLIKEKQREARIDELSILKDLAVLAKANGTIEDINLKLLGDRIAQLEGEK